MKAVQFHVTIPRFIYATIFGKLFKSAHYGPFSMLKYVDVPEPQVSDAPNDEWVKIRTKLSGVCGSELNTIFLHDSPALEAYTSSPFTFGHENIGIITEKGKEVKGFEVGDRVAIHPMLPCKTRGIEKVCELCEKGEFSSCLNFTKGNLPPGFDNMLCRDIGGGWSPYFLAHQFQLYKLPDSVSNENGVMVEPFCTSLHSVLRCFPKDTDTVLVIGAGMIGITVIAALRALGTKARIVVLAKYKFQGDWCKKYGADDIIYLREGDYYENLANLLGVTLKKPILGKRIVVDGGFDVIYECVGNDTAVNDALRFAKPGGSIVLIGLVGTTKKVDWSFSWFKELYLFGTNTSSTELFNGERIPTFQLAINWMAEGKIDLEPLLSRKLKLDDYKKAIKMMTEKGKHKIVKIVFEFD